MNTGNVQQKELYNGNLLTQNPSRQRHPEINNITRHPEINNITRHPKINKIRDIL